VNATTTTLPAARQVPDTAVHPGIEREQALRMAAVAKALADPVRVQLLDVLRTHAGKLAVYELVLLFQLSQPMISHHLKTLRDAGIIDCRRTGLRAFYFVIPDRLGELSAWLR
jgi:ArsR family transcriptional regulator